MTAPHQAAPTERRILLTRGEDDAAAWAGRLAGAGLAPVVLPCIDAEPIDEPGLAEALLDAFGRADWLVFTSRRGVEAFARLVGRPTTVDARVAAVGPATADAARGAIGRVDLVSERGTAESLADALIAPGAAGPAAGQRRPDDRAPVVVLALAENARDVLERRLRAAGADVRRYDVYRTIPAAPRSPTRPLSTLGVDAVWLASPSAVEGFLNQVELDVDVPLVAIGPSTAAAIRARGLAVAAEAAEPSFEGLLEATR